MLCQLGLDGGLQAVSSQPKSLLESHVDELQPEPGQGEHEDHIREGKAEPRRKVDHISVLRKESETEGFWGD